MSTQSTDTVVIIRPHQFTPNPETLADNKFQTDLANNNTEASQIAQRAYDEVTKVINTLKDNGINVQVFEDDGQWGTPDSVFPNNWFSIHSGNKMALYPMYAKNRRLERRQDIIQSLTKTYGIKKVVDLSDFEKSSVFLEGTGSMVLDHVNKIAYVAKSKRSDISVLNNFCEHFGYSALTFTATDDTCTPIYHTNVMMGIGTGYVVICLDSIKDTAEKDTVIHSLQKTGHEIIAISHDQMNNFSGNVLELDNKNHKSLAISDVAVKSLNREQKKAIENHAKLLPFYIPTIELAGGSIRCMLAEVFYT